MTEESKDGIKDQFTTVAIPLYEAGHQGGRLSDLAASPGRLNRLWEEDQKIPPIYGLMPFDFLKDALGRLRDRVMLGKRGISWEKPYMQLEYFQEWVESVKEMAQEEHRANLMPPVTSVIPPSFLSVATKGVAILPKEGIEGDARWTRVHLTKDLKGAVVALPEPEKEAKIRELAEGFEFPPLFVNIKPPTEGFQFPRLSVNIEPLAGEDPFTIALVCVIRPLHIDIKNRRAFYPLRIGLDFMEGDPAALSEERRAEIWPTFFKLISDFAASIAKETSEERPPLPKVDRESAIRAKDFPVASGYARPIYGLSKAKQDYPLLLQFHEPQTPLNWAVGLVLFSLTDENKIRAGDWQEAPIQEIEDLVFCLNEQGAPRRGDHRSDIMAEVVKLHTTRNWYFQVETVRVGRAWDKRAVIGSQYAMPELQLVFLDMKTGKRALPTDTAVRALKIPLEVKGRRIFKPDGKDIPALPKGRYKLEAIRWRWVQSFNDDLLIAPALEEQGRRKGLPKKTTGGKAIRKGYLIRVAGNIFSALHRLRAEGRGSLYACRLLVMLAHNLNKTERGIAADRVFRMLGIPENTHENREDIVARAVFRLKQKDIGALLPGSDEMPRTNPNPENRPNPYYQFIRAPEYTPRSGIASKEEAEAIEAEYAETAAPALPSPEPEAVQPVLPGMEAPPGPPVPSGAEIRAARDAAGVNLRNFAKTIKGPSFKTWSNYETGKRIRPVAPKVWQKVRDFIAQHGQKGAA